MKRLMLILVLVCLVGCATKEPTMKEQAEASRTRAYSSSHSKPTSSNEIIGEILLFTGEAAINYFLWDSGHRDLNGMPPPDWFKGD